MVLISQVTGFVRSDNMFFLILIICTATYGLLLTLLTKSRRRYETRINKFLPNINQDEILERETRRTEGRGLLKQIISIFSIQFEGKFFVQKWRKSLEIAGIPLKPEEFFVLKLLSFLGASLLGFVLGYPPGIIVLKGIIGFFIPSFYLRYKQNKRLQRCAEQLPNALGTMSNALKAGFSFLQAMQIVAREFPDPLGTEFKKTLREINLGVPLEEALYLLHNRLPNEDLKLVVQALIIQRTTGGNLSDILETMQQTVRGRVKLQEELRTLTAQGRMSAWIITLLPVVMFFLLKLMNPEYFNPMFNHTLGWVLIGVGSFSGLLGWVMIQKIVKIEV
jgi:tight adherence protein B